MKDKPKTRMIGISVEAPSLKALMTEVLFLWADAFKISWGQLSSLEFRQLMDADKLNMEVLRYARLDVCGSLLCFLALLRYGFATDIQNCFQLFAHDTMEPELVADLARMFRETFEDKYKDQQWKGAYDMEEMMGNTNALYFMMRGEAIATYNLLEEQAPVTFYCPPHFSNSHIEPQPVPRGWYPWVERKVKTPRKRKSTEDSEGEPTNDWDLEDILAARQFGWPIEPREIEMKQGKWPKGVVQFTNNIRDQVSHLRDYYHPKINRSIVPIVKELHEKNVNPLIYFLWPHSVQEWKAWVPGFTSGMWSSI
uniref:Uncharacterized protein n=1 Tax=Romanomermis culicivorax TaxID=13658 RepID=A0A915IXU2_ROMCU